MSTRPDVVVTGIGATTPLAGTAPETWQAMLEGRIGVTALTEPWAEKYDLPVRVYAPLAVEPTDVLPRVEARRLDRCQQVALVAAREAWADAGEPELDPERLGVIVGTGIGGALTLLGQDDILENVGIRKVAVLTIPMLMPNGPAAAVGLWAKARGGVHAPVSACASGAEGIAWAYKMIQEGEIDIAIAGGAEHVTGHRLGGGDDRVVADGPEDGVGLRQVADRCRGGVGVDVPDVGLGQLGGLQGLGDRPGRALSVRLGGGDVE